MLLPAYLPTHTLGLATACDCPACPHLLLPCPRVLPHCPHLPLPTPATAHSTRTSLWAATETAPFPSCNCLHVLPKLPPCATAPICYCPYGLPACMSACACTPACMHACACKPACLHACDCKPACLHACACTACLHACMCLHGLTACMCMHACLPACACQGSTTSRASYIFGRGSHAEMSPTRLHDFVFSGSRWYYWYRSQPADAWY